AKMTEAMGQVPGAIGFAQQASLFGRGFGGSNSVAVDIMGADLTSVIDSTEALHGALMGKYGPPNVRPDPSNYDRAGPELRLTVDRVRAAELGIDGAALGLGVRALVDGARVGDFRVAGESIDIVAIGDPSLDATPEALVEIPLAWRQGGRSGVIPLGSVVKQRREPAPQQIKRIEELRAVSLTVTPGDDVALEQAAADIQAVVADLRQKGAVDPDVEINFAGTADKLTQVREALLGKWHGLNFRSVWSLVSSRLFIALLITYLLMAALFESFLYPLVILFSVPLATIGGFLGLRIAHELVPTQQLDVLTMLGFIILIGVVVNNAILIVHQALNFMRGEAAADELPDDVEERRLGSREAIRASVRTRMRPVLMTTTTSVFGMLPLVLMPGAGSELYRGLGSVVIGGLVVATLFTLLVVPLVFALAMDLRSLVVGRQVTESDTV
ncbi:MAG: efflux RND transporter permease subunit, partial [Phycisphaeraceae bacterium]|nr:efflux RND transporter permease subunit [Phycisphaeraceae bacterium]